jgi:sialic acid synthase SpsE
MAKEMIKAAKESGAGAAKFQLHDPKDSGFTPWTRDHALTFDQAKELFDFGQSIGMEVFFSVFAPKYVEWGERIGVKTYKLAADTPDDIVQTVFRTRKPIIQSFREHPSYNMTGRHWSRLYCPPGYPQPLPQFMAYYFESSEWPEWYDGFSDHTLNLDASKIALARGAQIIERHVVLKHNPLFPDDAWSSTFEEIAELVKWEATCRSVLQ